MPISSLNWQTARLAAGARGLLGTVALFVVGLVLLGRRPGPCSY